MLDTVSALTLVYASCLNFGDEELLLSLQTDLFGLESSTWLILSQSFNYCTHWSSSGVSYSW